jgi:regulation of enolase protein 1 (concanavalin A-like superfamily)
MVNDFGPWATMFDTGPRANLGTFWKRRLLMLPLAKHANKRPSRRAIAVLLLFAGFTLAAPMISLSVLPAAPPKAGADSGSTASNTPTAGTSVEPAPGAASESATDKPAQTIKGFGKLVDPDGDCQVKEENGRVTIVIPQTWHDLTHTAYYSQLNAPRILQDAEGDFFLEDKVKAFESPTGKTRSGGIVAFVSSGLLIWQDERNFIRLDRAAYEDRLYVWVERFEDGKPVIQLVHDIEDNDTWLRVTRIGNRFAFSTSPDGRHWKEILAEVTKMTEHLKVGVSAINSTAEESSITIEDLKLKPSRE